MEERKDKGAWKDSGDLRGGIDTGWGHGHGHSGVGVGVGMGWEYARGLGETQIARVKRKGLTLTAAKGDCVHRSLYLKISICVQPQETAKSSFKVIFKTWILLSISSMWDMSVSILRTCALGS